MQVLWLWIQKNLHTDLYFSLSKRVFLLFPYMSSPTPSRFISHTCPHLFLVALLALNELAIILNLQYSNLRHCFWVSKILSDWLTYYHVTISHRGKDDMKKIILKAKNLKLTLPWYWISNCCRATTKMHVKEGISPALGLCHYVT